MTEKDQVMKSSIKLSNGPSEHLILNRIERKQILMSTAIVNVKIDNGYNYQLRVLLDSASETNFVTSCKRLHLNDIMSQ